MFTESGSEEWKQYLLSEPEDEPKNKNNVPVNHQINNNNRNRRVRSGVANKRTSNNRNRYSNRRNHNNFVTFFYLKEWILNFVLNCLSTPCNIYQSLQNQLSQLKENLIFRFFKICL